MRRFSGTSKICSENQNTFYVIIFPTHLVPFTHIKITEKSAAADCVTKCGPHADQ